MTVFNHGWLTFGGEPVTGRVPTQLVVLGDRALNPEQSGAVAHAYKLFCDAVTNSAHPKWYHVQNRVLPDGSRIRMTSNAGVHQVVVWVEGGKKLEEALRGFVVRPIWATSASLDYNRQPALVWNDGNWFIRKQPYRPGKPTETPTYSVGTRRSNHDRPVKIQSDEKYFDVFTLLGTQLTRNGQAYKGVPSGAAGVPLLTFTPRTPPVPGEDQHLYLVSDGSVEHLNEPPEVLTAAWAEVFDRASAIDVIVAGSVFAAGPSYDEAAKKLCYSTQNVTGAGAVQAWHANVQLQASAPPWVTVSPTVFQQLNAAGELLPTGAWVASTRTPGGPVFGIQDARAYYTWHVYSWPPRASNVCTYVTTLANFDLVPQVGSLEYVYDYNRSFSDSGSVQLADGLTASCSRNVSISNQLVTGDVAYLLRSGVSVYVDSVGDPTGYTLRLVPGSFGGPNFSASTPFAVALNENRRNLTHTDTATSTTTVGAESIYSSSISHQIQHKEGTHADVMDTVEPAGALPLGGYNTPTTGAAVALTRNGVPYPARNERTETFNVSATTKDFFYVDATNNVRGWVEATLTGTRIVTKIGTSITTTGSSSLTVELKLATPWGSFESTVGTYSAGPVAVATGAPPDVNFGTLETTWTATLPKRGNPVYAPRWAMQGACPHIAYTTAAEVNHAPPPPAVSLAIDPRLAASFRLQLVRTVRPLSSPSPPSMPDATQFPPYMMEQLLAHHWPVVPDALWGSIEATMARLNASVPALLLETIGFPELSTTFHPHYYRT